MARYRCYFLDREGHIRSAENFEVEDLDAAIAQALALMATKSDRHSIEIWQGASRLYPPQQAPA